MKKRGVIAILLAALLVGLVSAPVLANERNPLSQNASGRIIQPYWTNLISYYNYFDIEPNGKALVDVIADARNCDEIRIEAHLQQYRNGIWTTIKSWSKISPGTSCNLGEKWYVSSGYSYRMVSSVKVYNNGMMVEQMSYTSPIRSH